MDGAARAQAAAQRKRLLAAASMAALRAAPERRKEEAAERAARRAAHPSTADQRRAAVAREQRRRASFTAAQRTAYRAPSQRCRRHRMTLDGRRGGLGSGLGSGPSSGLGNSVGSGGSAAGEARRADGAHSPGGGRGSDARQREAALWPHNDACPADAPDCHLAKRHRDGGDVPVSRPKRRRCFEGIELCVADTNVLGGTRRRTRAAPSAQPPAPLAKAEVAAAVAQQLAELAAAHPRYTARDSVPSALEIRTSAIAGAGEGVFAKAALLPHTLLAPYLGEVAADDACGDYVLEATLRDGSRIALDAHDARRSNWVRYVNGAARGAHNVEFALDGRGLPSVRVGVRGVAAGAELLAHYGPYFQLPPKRRRRGALTT